MTFKLLAASAIAMTLSLSACVMARLREADLLRVLSGMVRTLATENRAERLGNPGLEVGRADVIVGGLWLVLSAYGDVVPAAFFTAFVITVIVFSMAFFVRE